MEVKYRLFEPRLRPRRTKLEVPGWAGKREPRKDGSHEYAWHCVPFSESARYGIELFYPFDNELRVTTQDGHYAGTHPEARHEAEPHNSGIAVLPLHARKWSQWLEPLSEFLAAMVIGTTYSATPLPAWQNATP
jgi:hypothetical protein